MWIFFVVLFTISGSLCRNVEVDTLEEHVKVVDVNATAVEKDATGARVVGGVATSIERFPYTVQVMRNNQLSCGGILMTSRQVLSAAHCFVDENTGTLLSTRLFSVRAGSAIRDSGGQTSSVSRITIHERYNVPLRDNDVAILRLSARLTLGGRVAVAAIPRQGAVVPDNAGVVKVGWGATQPQIPTLSSQLVEVSVFNVNRQQCASYYAQLGAQLGQSFIITDSMICTGVLGVGGRDACQGDSGGPVIYNGVVVGVISWGYSCAEPWFPGVNARVASYSDWIVRTVEANAAGGSKASAIISLVSFLIALRVR